MHRKICTFIAVMAFVILSAGCAFGVAIDAANFPDASFRSHVKQYDTGWTEYDSNGDAHWVGHDDGFLDWPEIERVTGMNAFRHSSVKGIENFTMLDTLGVNGNDNYADGPGETFLTEVDVSALNRLGLFNCFHNRINALDVSHNPELWSLLCFDNNIQHLDVSHNPKLRILMCDQNPLGQLNVSNNTQLENLRCYRNELKALNVRNNPALSVLYCFDNQISELDLSNNPEMEELQCHNNPLGELDVSHNLKLKYLFCGSDDLRELDVTNNQSLMTLHCWSNHLTELDLSKNTALTEVLLGVQEANGLKVKAVPEGYEVCLNDYVSDVNNIDIFRVGANDYSMRFTKYSNENGKATVIFPEPPKTLHYFYDTRSPNNDQLYVVIKASLNVDVIERGKGKDLIIGGMNDNCYLDTNGNAVTESSIADLSARVYGKKGFVADGNSRLIVRVKTQRPGKVEFELKDNIGVEIEKLNDREKLSGYYNVPFVNTTETSEGNYQASIVLVAPEMYPSGKNFPSDKFTVHVKFTADDTGEEIPEEEKEMEEDIELEIHAAPVVLIHSLGGGRASVGNFFADNGNGVLPMLRNAGFTVYAFDYYGAEGISTSNLLSAHFGDLFNKLVVIFGDYSRRGIVCTKADLIGHGSGGLIARHFCMPIQKLDDGNYFTYRSYRQGMVRRIITISTPHMGTLWGNAFTNDWSLIKANAGLGSANAAYVALKYLMREKFAFWIFGGLSTGWDLLAVSKSAWSDVAVGSVYTNSGFPADVPMYSIYGKAKYAYEKAHLLKGGLSMGIGKLLDKAGKLSVLLKAEEKFSELVNKIPDKLIINDPRLNMKIDAIHKKFDEINKMIGEEKIRQLKEHFKRGGKKADLEELVASFKKTDEIINGEKIKQLEEAIKKYPDLKMDISGLTDIIKKIDPKLNAEDIENADELVQFIQGYDLSGEALSVGIHQDHPLRLPSWLTGLADVASVLLSAPAALIDLYLEMPFAVLGLIFGDDDYDMFTSETSVSGNFAGASLGFEGWRYRYDSICKQNDVAQEVCDALREQHSSRFKIFGTSAKHNMPSVKAESNEDEDDDITLRPDEIFLTHFELSADRKILRVSDKGFLTLTSSADTEIDGEVFIALQKDGYDIMIPMFRMNDDTFEIIIEIDSTDAGEMTAYCFSQSQGNKIYVSNTINFTVIPDLSSADIVSLSFTGSENGVIFTDSSSDIPAGLIAQTSDDFAFEVSSPLMGTSWTSSNPSAAYVTNDGMIHSLADGTATLTASYAGLTASIIVNVGNNFSAPEITSQSLNAGNVGKNYTAQLRASGTPLISWRIIDGRLPFDLTLSDSGMISGYPSEEGTFTFTAEASNIFGTDSKDFTITVGNAAGAAVTIDANNFPDDSFRAFISDNLDWNHDGLLTEQEITGVTAIDVSNMGIKSLKGIEYFTALMYLTCTNNELAELDLSKNENIYGVASQNNKLESINLANCLKLFQIWLDNNKLSSLDFSHCPALNILSCKNNLITTLDLRRQANITDIQCDEGVEILYSDTPGGSEILIDANNFPDDAFRKFIADNFDWDKSSSLSESEIAAITGIEAVNMDIKSLKGIEHFTALEYLTCADNELEEIDLSGNPNFIGLAANNNKLKRVNVSNNPKLYQIWVNNNKLTALDFSHNPELAIIDCSKNFLTELDISENANLRELYFVNYPDEGSEDVDCHTLQGNAIRNIDLSGAPLLTHIACSANGIETLDLSNNPLLEHIECHNNYLTQIDTSIFTELKYLHVGGNKLSTLDVSQNLKLQELFCGDNLLETLTLGDKPEMFRLHCWGNNLQSLNLTECPALKELHFSSNKISAADLTNCKELVSLDCGNNLLETLTLGDKPGLLKLYCYRNNLKELNLSGCPALKELSFGANKISAVDITHCKELESLAFWDNLVTELDISEHVKLKDCIFGNNRVKTLNVGNKPELLRLHCYSNDLSAVDVTGCPVLQDFSCEGNKISVLDVTKCKELESLYCKDNLLKVLDLSECPKITTLTVDEGVKLIYTHEETPPEILTETLTNAATNQPYSLQLTASGATPLTWTHTGKLPAGLSLSESGLISGTPTKAGKSSFTVTAENSYGKTSKPFTLEAFDPVSITTASLKAGTITKSYSVTMRAKGSKTITWSAEGLPDGLTINEKGKISGKPTVYGVFDVKLKAENGAGITEKTLQLEIKAIPPTLSGTLAKPTLNVPYSSGLKLSKGSTPVTWSVEGNLPGGLTLDPSTGIISGTPTSYDKSGFKIIITAANYGGSRSKKITLKVNGKAPKITSKLPGATAGQYYSAELSATGSEPITFAAEFPEYLTLDGSTISGTVPDSVKSFKITAYASNPVKKNVKKSYTIKVSAKKSLPQNQNDDNNTDIKEINKGVDSEVIVNVPDPTENIVHLYSESYVIVAELGEISCDMAGIYDFEIEIPDCQLEGSELVYIANSDSPSEDDEIAEFYDDEWNEISEIPESRKITVSIWLNPGRIYMPVIAVKH